MTQIPNVSVHLVVEAFPLVLCASAIDFLVQEFQSRVWVSLSISLLERKVDQIVLPQQVSLFLSDSYRIPHTNLRLLRRYWADWLKWLYEKQLQSHPNRHRSVKIIFHLFTFERSSREQTRCSENWVSAFSEFDHHQFSESIPFSSWSFFVRGIPLYWQEVPGMTNFLLEIFYIAIWCHWTSIWRLFVLGIVLVRPFCSLFFGLRRRGAMWWILGKYSNRIPLAHHQLCPKFCILMNVGTIPTVSPKHYLMLGSDSCVEDVTQNLRIHKPLHARDWWLLHHSPERELFPWIIFQVDLRHSKNLIWLFRYQLFRYLENLL